MRLHNTSRYPTDEVRRLVEFGTRGVETAGVAIHVKNCAHPFRGRAYPSPPACSPTARLTGVRYLITVGVGAPTCFPADNMVTRDRWVAIPEAEAHGRADVRWSWSRSRGTYAQRLVVERHPYGGKRSPFIEYRCWREALVGVAAHEARHVHQFRHGKPRSEVDCERFAAAAVERYRRAEARLAA